MAWSSGAIAAPQMTTEERDALLVQWQAAKKALDDAKDTEADLRQKGVAALKPTKDSGTEYAELGAGYRAKMVLKLNYGFGESTNDQVEAMLDEIEKIGNEGAFLADRLVKWKPELSVTEYKALDPENESHAKIKAA